MDTSFLTGFRRWIEDKHTPVSAILDKRDGLITEIAHIRDLDARRAASYLVELIDDELQARDDVARLRHRCR